MSGLPRFEVVHVLDRDGIGASRATVGSNRC